MSKKRKKSKEEVASKYYRAGRDEMLPFIPEGEKNYLEVGCGDGAFGEALQAQGRVKEYWGLEIHPPSGTTAAQKLDKVLVGNAEQLVDELPDAYFDVMVFNDSLEHLVDPFLFLEKAKKKLKPGGTVVASIPNVRHFRNMYQLIFKKQWRYVDSGILDRTHLRFFTCESIKEMFNNAGFSIVQLEGIHGTRKRKIKLLQFLSFGLLSDIGYLQFAVVAKVAATADA
ncbi:MAG: class I SAM-dependent methyltransferase [Gammaproteobacteria bacterium]|nr:class I SAM-dependent methyltransferase [Gammaproteobacteria bacterium]MBQ0838684.1 class I SAM-dependent methyltransferase [Gammaproteobacteria bacterium]